MSVTELCDQIVDRKYALNFWAYVRVNTVSQPRMVKMKAAGISWLAYGSKRVIKDFIQGYNTEKVMEVVQ